MSDTIGRITVPAISDSGLTFPLVSDFAYSLSQERPVVVHQFGTLDAKIEQRFQVGVGPRTFGFKRARLSFADRNRLVAFWEGLQGPWQSFTYNAPNADQTTSAVKVRFANVPLSLQYLQNGCQAGITFVEVPDPTTAPSYSVTHTAQRFPPSAMQSALLGQVQQIIPLVQIRVRESAVPDIFLSDRRCTIGGQLYQPRLIGMGEPGGDVLMSQDISGKADNVQFTFGNADRVMTQLANDTDLKFASISLLLFHVNSGTLLQLWKGFVQSFTSDGSASFPVKCSDGLFQLMQQYPNRTISRTCWKTFNDGVNCPYSTYGSGGSATSCDYYYDSANGCEAHGMTRFFGGHPSVPQSVYIKDNSSGFLGFDRNSVTATSIVSDTMWGQALPDIWCNQGSSAVKAFMANAIIAAVRDNGDYFDVLGILGSGPIGHFTIEGNYAGEFVTNADGFTYLVAPMADGFPAQGLKIASNGTSTKSNSALGLRQVWGNDPIPSGDQSYEQFGLANIVGAVPPPLPFAAGTAFCELLYPKASGINPTAPESHSLTVPIAQGLSGRVWASDGSATWVGGLINPVWVAINSWLRAIGMTPRPGDTSDQIAAQLATFSLPDAVAAAAICDTVVTPLLGTGTELQFQFQGIVGTQKPFRDWLVEILACALCYFTFEFGTLKIGIRINASAVDSYTLGNMIYQSLRLEPTEAAFEKLTISYADVAYQYQANTAEYQDKTHAEYYGRGGSPLSAQQHVVGCSTLSQGLRLAATRVREEIGGVNAAEWRCARMANWSTSLLGLSNEVGQVVSITHPDVPGLRGTCNIAAGVITWVSGDAFDPSMQNHDVLIAGVQYEVTTINTDGSGNITSIGCDTAPPNATGASFRIITGDYRIQSWQLCRDWSVRIAAKTVTPSMYDLDVGPKPFDVNPTPLPSIWYPIPFAPMWAPDQVQAPSNDPLFPSEWNFDANQVYTALSDTGLLVKLAITGKLPVNEFIPNCSAPAIGGITQNTTGGSIPGGDTYRVTICAFDATGKSSPPARIELVVVATGTNTNQIDLTGITWPAITGLATYGVFVSNHDDLICYQQGGALTATGGGTTYTPGSLTINGPFARSTWALPSPYVSKVRVRAKQIVHSGIAGVLVDAMPSSTTIVCGELVDTVATFSPVGRIVSVIGRQGASTPWWSGIISAFDPATGTVTFDRVANVIPGDVIVIRNQADAANTSNQTQITDSGYQNSTNAYGGLTAGVEVGNLLRVISGTGRGNIRKITGNTATTLTWDLPLLLDTTSVWIVEAPTWDYAADASAIDNADPTKAVTLTVPASNFVNESILIAGFTVDINGNESPDGDNPIREDWIYGAVGQVKSLVIPAAGTLGIQSDAAGSLQLNSPFTAASVKAVVKQAPTGAALVLSLYAGSTLWMTLTIADGAYSVTATDAQIQAATPLPANTNIRLSITAVGTTFPGADLTVFVYA
jgi:hypothetical protein